MLLVLSAPPSTIDELRFRARGVSARTTLDGPHDGAKLAERHGFKDLALDIARPLLGDTRFGGLIRRVGERWLRYATNFAVVLSVDEPRWRSRKIRGADAHSMADIFSRRATAREKRPGRSSGCVSWHSVKE